MSNPEPHGFPQGDQQSGANWPFLRSEQAQPVGQPVGSQPQPAFPAPSAPKAPEVPQYNQQFPQAAAPVQPVRRKQLRFLKRQRFRRLPVRIRFPRPRMRTPCRLKPVREA